MTQRREVEEGRWVALTEYQGVVDGTLAYGYSDDVVSHACAASRDVASDDMGSVEWTAEPDDSLDEDGYMTISFELYNHLVRRVRECTCS